MESSLDIFSALICRAPHLNLSETEKGLLKVPFDFDSLSIRLPLEGAIVTECLFGFVLCSQQ